MAGRHKAQRESLTIVRTTEITNVEDVRRPYTKQIIKGNARFPLLHKRLRTARRTHQNVFHAHRPNLVIN